MDKYHDPLHIPSADLVVWHKGKEHMMLNKALMDQQNCWENLETLKSLHKKRLKIEDKLADKRRKNFKALLNEWTLNQYALQKAWGFPENAKYHRFWDIPACACPTMDNSDSWPHGFYVKSGGCRIHWPQVLEQQKEDDDERLRTKLGK